MRSGEAANRAGCRPLVPNCCSIWCARIWSVKEYSNISFLFTPRNGPYLFLAQHPSYLQRLQQDCLARPGDILWANKLTCHGSILDIISQCANLTNNNTISYLTGYTLINIHVRFKAWLIIVVCMIKIICTTRTKSVFLALDQSLRFVNMQYSYRIDKLRPSDEKKLFVSYTVYHMIKYFPSPTITGN